MCNDSTKIGGIEFESAKKKLQVQDKLDRKRERERIKAIHKERRRKTQSSEKIQLSGIVTLADHSDVDSECEPTAKHTKVDTSHEQLGVNSETALSDDEELALHLLRR